MVSSKHTFLNPVDKWGGATVIQVSVESNATVDITIHEILTSTATDLNDSPHVIDWGDGERTLISDEAMGYTLYHIYQKTGDYIIQIGSDVARFIFEDSSSGIRETKLLAWGKNIYAAPYTFDHCSTLVSIPEWGENIEYATYTFNRCENLRCSPPKWGKKMKRVDSAFRDCYSLTGEVPKWTDNIISASFTFCTCGNLQGGIPPWTDTIENVGYVFGNCTSLNGTIPPWGKSIRCVDACYSGCTNLHGNIPPWETSIKEANYVYKGCTGITGAWTDNEFELMPSHITAHTESVTDSSEALQQLFYPSWGGKRPLS